MSDEAEDQDHYVLAMPFLPVASNDGPYEDEAYAAGWEMGAVDALLKTGTTFVSQYILEANREQVDLLAMRYGYAFAAEEPVDGYVLVNLTRRYTP